MEDTGRLDVLKALGDNTRYAIYLELARSSTPRSTAEVAEALGLHANTVRPHLERMREVGLLAVHTDNRGSVGRPQNRYALAPDAPSLGLEPPAFPVLARMLNEVAAAAGAGTHLSAEAGADQGRALAEAYAARAAKSGDGSRQPRPGCVAAVTGMLAELGFDPAVVEDDKLATIAFTHCPYAELAAAHPEVVCHLHRGLIEGFVESIGGAGVDRFRTLADRDPCRVELSIR
ncbi:MAG TPA: helix-turn-helix domain-containing protein [Acidimicrobiales bacterium]|nr:helix-turn-helix domain-containing protein [Acidimicrobiales bacterium]